MSAASTPLPTSTKQIDSMPGDVEVKGSDIRTDLAVVCEAPLSTGSEWAEDSDLMQKMKSEVKAVRGWTIQGQLAPRMTDLAWGVDDDGFCEGIRDVVTGEFHKLLSSHPTQM